MDDKETIGDYVKKEKFTFRIGLAEHGSNGDYAIAKQFGVMAYPTNYLVGADGKILFRSLGFDEAGLRAALEKAGIK